MQSQQTGQGQSIDTAKKDTMKVWIKDDTGFCIYSFYCVGFGEHPS